MSIRPEAVGAAVTLLGSFNPEIFQPAWLEAQQLLRPEEREAAQIEVIHNEIALVKIEPLLLQVTRDRFLLRTSQESSFPRLRDLTIGAFKTLSHTPARVLGMNWWAHFRMKNTEEWHELGYKLVPRKPWNNVFEPGQHEGMRSLTVQAERTDERDGYVRVKVEPSQQVDPGVFIHVNDHYIWDQNEKPGTSLALEILQKSWDSSLKSARKTANSLMELV